MSSLKKIDFNNGIRSENIDYNFKTLDEEIAKDRLNTIGYGIEKGLDIEITDFNLHITAGTIVDYTGHLIDIPETVIEIEKPRLSQKISKILVGNNGQVVLDFIPYDKSRLYPATIHSTNLNITLTGVGTIVEPRAINDRIITVSNNYSNKKYLNVSYYYTNKRYDIIYIDKNNQIKINEGSTSPSPSLSVPDPINSDFNKEDINYILGYLEINPFYEDINHIKYAKVTLFKDLRNYKNIYTDEDNQLFICGQSFKDLQIIHMVMPLNPTEGTLWYDIESNKLKVWLTVDGISDWRNVNDTSIYPVYEVATWNEEQNPNDLQTFYFDAQAINMHYNPNRKEITLHIDQYILNYDQFEELTLENITAEQKEELINNYHYTESFFDFSKKDYENIGIGFKLNEPLDKPSYIEAVVTHRVKNNPLMNRFQRSSLFKYNNSLLIDSTTKIITLEKYYRYNENQVTLYLDGIKLIKDIDYKEISDSKITGKATNQIEIIKTINKTSVLEYEIITSIYSYDHIDATFGDAIKNAKKTLDTANETLQVAMDLKQGYNQTINQPRFISQTVVVTNEPIELEDICETDYLTAFKQTAQGSFVLIRKVNPMETIWDYKIENSADKTYISFNNIPVGSTVYLSGVKLRTI